MHQTNNSDISSEFAYLFVAVGYHLEHFLFAVEKSVETGSRDAFLCICEYGYIKQDVYLSFA